MSTAREPQYNGAGFQPVAGASSPGSDREQDARPGRLEACPALARGPKPSLSLSALHEVELTAPYRAIYERVAPGAAGPEPWKRRQLGAAHEMLALAQVSGRMVIQFLELGAALRAVFLLRVPVPCRNAGTGPLVLEPAAQLGFTYRQEAMTLAQPGYSFFEILAPRDVHHPNIAPSYLPPGAQVLCLGPSLPAGIKVVDLILAAYAAISLQSVQFSLTDSAGLLHPAAAIFLQTSNTPIPLTRDPFVMPKEAVP
jgi:hypothetical protein